MNSDSDPLLHALVDEDPACPDGRMLVALGRLIRLHARPAQSADLGDDILARLNNADVLDLNQVDTLYDGEPANVPSDDQIARLGDLMRSLAPQPVDLREKVINRLRTSSRLATLVQRADSAFERSRRWRIWSMVVAGHVAALLAFTVFEFGFNAPGQTGSSLTANLANEIEIGKQPRLVNANRASILPGTSASLPSADPKERFAQGLFPGLPAHLPANWNDAHGNGYDLFLLRRFPELREQARSVYGLSDSRAAVTAALAWLSDQQDPTTGCFGVLSGNEPRDLAIQSVAILAQLGEGFDHARIVSARRGLGWLCGHLVASADGTGPAQFSNLDQVSAGLVCLALVEGGLMLSDPALKAQGEQCLMDLNGKPMDQGASGLGGFLLLAVETAEQGGLHVPPQLLRDSRENIGHRLPTQDDDTGRLGIAAFTRFILGRGILSTKHEIECLKGLLPNTDSVGRVDPLGWFFATLAMREAGGATWNLWGTALQSALLPALNVGTDGKAHVPASHIRYGESTGDIFATSLVVLDLQVPYRYLPLSTN